MKNKIIFLMMALSICFTGTAQFRVGAKAGVNMVKMNGISFTDQFEYGYHAGGFLEIGLIPKKLSLQPELLWSQYSTTVASSYTTVYQNVITSAQLQVELNYLTIPILLNYKFVGPLYIQAGPQYGILLDKEQTLLQNGEQAFKKGAFSMIGGAQLRLTKICLNARYVVGLNNINDIDNKDSWKSQALQLSLGLVL